MRISIKNKYQKAYWITTLIFVVSTSISYVIDNLSPTISYNFLINFCSLSNLSLFFNLIDKLFFILSPLREVTFLKLVLITFTNIFIYLALFYFYFKLIEKLKKPNIKKVFYFLPFVLIFLLWGGWTSLIC